MIDINSFSDIIGYVYRSNNVENTTNFLFSPSRAGCTYPKEGFDISNSKEYKYFTLHILFSGYSFFEINSKQFLLKKGDAFIIASGEEHRYYNADNSNLGLIWIEIDFSGNREVIEWFKSKHLYVLDSSVTDNLIQKLVDFIRFLKNNENHDKFLLSSFCYDLIMELYRTADYRNISDTPSAILGAIYYINTHFSDNIKINDIVKFLKISESSLNKQFQKHIGTSVGKYIQLKKIEHAVFLLKNTDFSCDTIAEKCGLYDASHLYKIFIRHMGISPSDIRK